MLITDIFSGLPAKFLYNGFNQYCPDDLGNTASKGRFAHGLGKSHLPHPFLAFCLTDLKTKSAT